MRKSQFLVLIFIGLLVIVSASCNEPSPGVPGGQATAKSVGGSEIAARQPVEILLDGKPLRELRWQELQGLREEEFGTGLEDIQTGYLLVDVLAYLDIHHAQAVTLYGPGLRPVTLKWDEIANRENQILLGLTHKGTAKVVAGNSAVLNRDGWIRHLSKIEIYQNTSPGAEEGRISEPGVNPQHPRK